MVLPLGFIAGALIAAVGAIAGFNTSEQSDQRNKLKAYYDEQARIAKIQGEETLSYQRMLYRQSGVSLEGTPNLVATDTEKRGRLQQRSFLDRIPDEVGFLDFAGNFFKTLGNLFPLIGGFNNFK